MQRQYLRTLDYIRIKMIYRRFLLVGVGEMKIKFTTQWYRNTFSGPKLENKTIKTQKYHE